MHVHSATLLYLYDGTHELDYVNRTDKFRVLLPCTIQTRGDCHFCDTNNLRDKKKTGEKKKEKLCREYENMHGTSVSSSCEYEVVEYARRLTACFVNGD